MPKNNPQLTDHLELIHRAARRYITPMTPAEDLEQEGALLFYSARCDWDPERCRSFRAYLWYRCVGRFAYLKHAAYRDARRSDSLDELAEVLNPAELKAPAVSPEREARFRVELGRVGEDARKVLGLVFQSPAELSRKLNREGLRRYMTRQRTLGSTDQYQISRAFNEISAALERV
jgi:DNA-directed RNA polymerase specialized sigma24 family protein